MSQFVAVRSLDRHLRAKILIDVTFLIKLGEGVNAKIRPNKIS